MRYLAFTHNYISRESGNQTNTCLVSHAISSFSYSVFSCFVPDKIRINPYAWRHCKKKEEEECQIVIFFTSRGAYVNLRYIAMLYDWKSAVEHDGYV